MDADFDVFSEIKEKQFILRKKFQAPLIDEAILQFEIEDLLEPHNDELFRNVCAQIPFKIPGLDITAYNISSHVVTDELLKNQRVLNLDLTFCYMDFAELARVLKQNTSLRSLVLDQQQLGDPIAFAFAEMLVANNTLESLDLCENNIKDKGAIAIAKALRDNKKLKSLNLWRNKIKDDGAIALADAMCENTTLKTLNLELNRVSGWAKSFARASSNNNRKIKF